MLENFRANVLKLPNIDKEQGGYFENLSSRYNHLCGGDYSGI